METLKFKIIKTENQYQEYCSKLEELLNDVNPIKLLRSLMNEHKLKSPINSHLRNASVMNTFKVLESAQ